MNGSRGGRRLPELLLGLALLAVAVVITAFVVADAIKAVKLRRDQITVTGSARYPITSNLVTWHLGVGAEDQKPADAARELAGATRTIRAFLRSGGLTADDVTTPPLRTDVVQLRVPGHPKQRVTGYLLTQSFEVSTTDVAKVEALGGRVGELFTEGVPVSASRFRYVSTELAKAKREALKRATADAKARAETIVAGIGGHLGGVRKASLGVYQITPRNSTAVSDYGINDTSSRDKDVNSVVTITFAVS